MAKPNPRAPLGQGGRFAALEGKLSGRPGVTNPGGLAAYIGRETYGKGKFQRMAVAARSRKKRKKGGGTDPNGPDAQDAKK